MLQTTPAETIDDVRLFFDRFAGENFERHGQSDRLLAYRTRLLRHYARFSAEDVVIDIGCGNGNHLYALDGCFREGIGIDLSEGMVASARVAGPDQTRSVFRFYADDAHSLATRPDASADVVMCVGALEHMPHKNAVVNAVARVLRKGGRFVCLTLNDEFVWYRALAPAFGYATQHLATDRRLSSAEARTLLAASFDHCHVDYWSFVPRGDMPAGLFYLCRALEGVGHFAGARYLRGGLVLIGRK